MITIKSTGYWATGIQVCWLERAGGDGHGSRSGWSATIDFYDDGFCDDDADAGRVSTEGQLRTRYAVHDGQTVSGLTAAIDALLADAERLGIQFHDRSLYYRKDGEDPDWPAPDGWRALLAAQAERIGWTTPYVAAAP